MTNGPDTATPVAAANGLDAPRIRPEGRRASADYGLAALAALIAGMVGGALIGLLFGVAAVAESGSASSIPIAIFAMMFGAGAGGIAALIPGTAMAAALHRLDHTDLAPIAGAAIGATLAAGGYRLWSLDAVAGLDDILLPTIGFGLAGLIGGLVGGVFLRRRTG